MAAPGGNRGPGGQSRDVPPKAVGSRCATGAAAAMTLRAAAFVSCTWVAAGGRGRRRRGDNQRGLCVGKARVPTRRVMLHAVACQRVLLTRGVITR